MSSRRRHLRHLCYLAELSKRRPRSAVANRKADGTPDLGHLMRRAAAPPASCLRLYQPGVVLPDATLPGDTDLCVGGLQARHLLQLGSDSVCDIRGRRKGSSRLQHGQRSREVAQPHMASGGSPCCTRVAWVHLQSTSLRFAQL